MVHSKKFRVVLYVSIGLILALLVAMVCYTGSADTASATYYDGSEYYESYFPFAPQESYLNGYNTSFVTETSSAFTDVIGTTHYYVNDDRLNSGTATYNITPRISTLNYNGKSSDIYYLKYDISNTTSFSNYNLRITNPVSGLVVGNTYYLNIIIIDYEDADYQENTGNNMWYWSTINSNYKMTSLGSSILSLSIYDVYYNNEAIDEYFYCLSYEIQYTDSTYNSITLFNRYENYGMCYTITDSPCFNFTNTTTYTASYSTGSSSTTLNEYQFSYSDIGLMPYYFDNNYYNISIYASIYTSSDTYYIWLYPVSIYNFYNYTGAEIGSSYIALITFESDYFEFYFPGDFYSVNLVFYITNVQNSTSYFVGYDYGYNTAKEYYVDYYSDIASTSYSSGYNAGVAVAENGSFLGLFVAAIESPLQAVLSLFDVEILGYNMKSLYMALITLALVLFIVRLIMTGSKGKSE